MGGLLFRLVGVTAKVHAEVDVLGLRGLGAELIDVRFKRLHKLAGLRGRFLAPLAGAHFLFNAALQCGLHLAVAPSAHAVRLQATPHRTALILCLLGQHLYLRRGVINRCPVLVGGHPPTGPNAQQRQEDGDQRPDDHAHGHHVIVVAHQDDDRAGHGRDDRRLVIAKDARLAPHDDVTNHRSARGGKHAHHDARDKRQPISNGLHGACCGPEAGYDGIAMRLQIIPGLAFKVDKAGNERTGKGQVKVLRLAHGRHGAAVDQHVAHHAAAQGRKHRDEEKADDVIAALARHSAADDSHQQHAADIGPAVERFNERIHFNHMVIRLHRPPPRN